ncbi:hypothetical protein Tco_1423302 [Tanacetum coccineum]
MSRRSKDWKSTIRDPDEPSLLRSAMNHQPVIERKRDQGVEGGHKYDEASLLKDHKIFMYNMDDAAVATVERQFESGYLRRSISCLANGDLDFRLLHLERKK